MGLFENWFKKNADQKRTPPQQGTDGDIGKISDAHLNMALKFFNEEKYKQAFDLFKLVAENTGDTLAQYNLGILYARGLGIQQDHVEAAYWFNLAAQKGEEGAEKMTSKSLLDYANTVLRPKTPKEIYDCLLAFAQRVYHPGNQGASAQKDLQQLGFYYFNMKNDYAMSAKLFRAGAEYGNDGLCQNYLAVSYNAGAGVEQNDLAALYWFDRACDQGIAPARTDRDGILSAYITNLGKQETACQLRLLADWCATGATEAVPRDDAKAEYWMQMSSTL